MSFESIENNMACLYEEETEFLEGDYASVMGKIFFMHLHVHATESASNPYLHRYVCLWIRFCWFKNISWYCITTNIKPASGVILFVFLLMCEDMIKPFNATSYPSDHEFVCFRKNNIEFSTLGIVCLV